MDTTESSAPHAHPSTRKKARTNRGMFGSLERRYWRGVLTEEETARFEALICALRTLHKAASY